MSYRSEKEQMNIEANMHKKLVWHIIKFTFIALSAMLVLFCVLLAIDMITGDSVSKDTEPPTVIGPSNGMVYGNVGKKPTYKQMIKVSDNMDENPDIDVDNSKVDINKEGRYPVYYVVTDEAGNVTEYTLTYVVKKILYTEEQLMELIKAEVKKLGITSKMSKIEQVKKIYAYVNDNKTIDFVDESNIPEINRDSWEYDWIEEAVLTLKSNEGDCYSYYSLSKAFFEYLGIENYGIRRSEDYPGAKNDGTHFWSAVKVEGGWYYYDATRLRGSFEDGTRNACLITEEKLKSYVGSRGETYFYAMSKSGDFPTISTKEID